MEKSNSKTNNIKELININSDVFSSLTEKEITNLSESFQELVFFEYETIYKKNSISDSIYIIFDGQVSLSTMVSNVDTDFYVLKKGDIFGINEIYSENKRSYTSIALTAQTKIFRITYTNLLRIENKEFQLQIKKFVEKNIDIDFLKKVEIFTSLSTDIISEILSKLTLVEYKKDQVIISEGDKGDSLYIIRTGQVQVFVTKEGKKYPISTLEKFKYFGEIALFEENSVRKADIIAKQDCTIYELNKRYFDALIEVEPSIKESILSRINLYIKKEEIQDNYFETVYINNIEEDLVRIENGFPLVKSTEKISIELSCLSMVFSYHKKEFSFSKLQDILTNLHSPDLITSLGEASEYYGLFPKMIHLENEKRIKDLALPIIGIFNDENLFVLYQLDKNNCVIGVPSENKIKKISQIDLFKNWSGIGIEIRKFPEPYISDEEDKKDKKQKNAKFITILGKYYPYFYKNKSIIFEIFLISIILELLGLINPYLIQIIIDDVLVNHSHSLLITVIMAMTIISVFSTAIHYLRDILTIHFGNKIDIPLLIKFYQHFFNLKVKHIEEMKVGEIVNRFQENHKIKSLITGSTIGVFLDVFLSFIYLTAMFSYSVSLTFYVLGIVATFATITFITTPILKRNDKKAYKLANENNSILVESIQGINIIKTMSLEKNNLKKFELSYAKTLKQGLNNSYTSLVINTFTGFLNSISGLLLLWLGAKLIINGQLTLGQLMGFNALFGSVIGPLMNSIHLIDTIQETVVVIERLDEVLEKESEEKNKSSLTMLPKNVQGEIEFQNVSFGYIPEKKVINDISFTVTPGQSIALVGRSGSGKTSLIELVFKFNLPDSGKIKIDGFDTQSISNISLRRIIGYVPQDPFIFAGSIRENISLKNPNADLDEIIEVAKSANIHDFIDGLPLKYNTMIGEVGISLSGGQNQRIAIARALVGNPRILIFDEATSALDTESEKAIQKNLSEIMKGRTTFIIAHRLSTIKNADLIFVLDEGKIIETGSHSDLIEKQGLYYSLSNQSIGT